MEKNQNNYYVYEWIRLDTNEPFYVGKGKKNRWKILNRGDNEHFNNIVKTIPVVVNILHDNLTEEVAYGLECWYIWQYRDIIGYPMCNIQDGGEGCGLCGELNGMYGKTHSDESKEKISKNHSDVSGKNNPNYGKHWSDKWKKNHSEKMKEKFNGENNPMHGKCHSEETKNKMSENRKGKYTGRNSCNKKAVVCITTLEIFYTASEGALCYNRQGTQLVACCRGRYNSCGKLPNGTPLKWMYLNDFLEQCEYTLL